MKKIEILLNYIVNTKIYKNKLKVFKRDYLLFIIYYIENAVSIMQITRSYLEELQFS